MYKKATKKFAALALGGLLTFGLALPLAACKPENSVKLPEWPTQVKITSDGVVLSLTKVEGAKEYKIYHAKSRFGTYELVSTQKELEYKNADKYGYYRVDAVDGNKVIASEELSYDRETFGDTMRIYSPSDDQSKIQAEIDAACDATAQFSEKRYAAYFKSGNYDELDLKMRYYMTFGGLGELPTDVSVSRFNVYAELGNNATCNFWCGIENMSVESDVQWAVSQATSFRRMKVNGNMALTQKENGVNNNSWGSGGFIADSHITGTIDAGMQQQWLTRGSLWGKWIEGDMNLTFVGSDEKAPIPAAGVNGFSSVEVKEEPVISEKPYLTFDGKGYFVSVPEIRKNAKGVSWASGDNNRYISLDKFYVARADRDTAATINAALDAGKSIFFTPGIYKIDSPVLVKNKDTILLGTGLTSLKLTEKNTDTIMRVYDVDGVRIGGLIFDAGPESESLLEVGDKKTSVSHQADPIVLSDVYFRIGGAKQEATFVNQTLIINANDVIGDNFWVWRADHGSGVGWATGGTYTDWQGNEVEALGNVTKNGVIVNGDRVTIYGLMVEHFHEYQTVWNGEDGFMCFYQSETPYDAPDQASWMSHDGQKNGWASYKIADDVQNHTAYGLGVYHVLVPAILDSAIEAPSNSGIRLEHMMICSMSPPDNSGIRHIVNDYGKEVIKPWKYGQKVQFTSFIAGVATE